MLILFSFLLVLLGCLNWFSISILQYDFVAGLFGSQSSIFSRMVYFLVGVSAFIILFNLIKNKWRLTFNFKKFKKNINEQSSTATHPQIDDKMSLVNSKLATSVEHSTDASKDDAVNSQNL